MYRVGIQTQARIPKITFIYIQAPHIDFVYAIKVKTISQQMQVKCRTDKT